MGFWKDEVFPCDTWTFFNIRISLRRLGSVARCECYYIKMCCKAVVEGYIYSLGSWDSGIFSIRAFDLLKVMNRRESSWQLDGDKCAKLRWHYIYRGGMYACVYGMGSSGFLYW